MTSDNDDINDNDDNDNDHDDDNVNDNNDEANNSSKKGKQYLQNDIINALWSLPNSNYDSHDH